jgi:arylsulfatase A-like enzyme
MPARRDIMTGRIEFLERGWGSIEPFDITLPEKLQDSGIFTHIVTDHYHYLEKGGENYLTSFNTWEVFRGQENDPWVSRVMEPEVPKHLGRYLPQYYLNSSKFKNEEDFPGPKTFRSAVEWLQANQGADDYFLWIEAFDPHEPFDCPEKYLEMYDDTWPGLKYFWSGYEEVEEDSEATKHLRIQYAATVTMIDHWFGRFLDEVERQGLLEDSLIIVTSDHGHLLGEHGLTGKNFMPMYKELAHIPCLVHLPGSRKAGQRISALTQNIDIYPTLLEYFNVDIPGQIHGISWKGLLEDSSAFPRDTALFGYFSKSVNLTDGEYIFIKSAKNESNAPLYLYSAMPTAFKSYWPKKEFHLIEAVRFLNYTDMPVFRLPVNIEDKKNLAVNLRLIDDRRGSYNNQDLLIKLDTNEVFSDLENRRELVGEYKKKLFRAMTVHGAPQEQYERLGMRGLGE